MTREEAINLLETTKHCDVDEVAKIKAIDKAIAALREQSGGFQNGNDHTAKDWPPYLDLPKKQEPVTNRNGLSGWISVKDELPEDDVQVLACTKHGKAFSAHCEKGRWRVSGSVKVTHWMPLPEPPEVEV